MVTKYFPVEHSMTSDGPGLSHLPAVGSQVEVKIQSRKGNVEAHFTGTVQQHLNTSSVAVAISTVISGQDYHPEKVITVFLGQLVSPK